MVDITMLDRLPDPKDDLDWVTDIFQTKPSTTILVGNTERLYAEIVPNYATNQGVTWKTSNTTVATVDQNGVVTGIKEGEATITATANDRRGEGAPYSASWTVTVSKATVHVTGVTLDKSSISSLKVNQKQTLIATVNPPNATDQVLNWSTSNSNVVEVEQDGKVTAIAAGTATITATARDNGIKATCTVTVLQSPTGISLNKSSIPKLIKGSKETLTATVIPSNAADKSVTWSSDKPSIAEVSSSGVVTAKASGMATITVTTVDGGKTATCTVNVHDPVTNITLTPSSATIIKGKTETLTAIIDPNTASDQTVDWISSNPTVAEVSSSGVVTANAVGTTTITVTANDKTNGTKTATCTVTVAQDFSVTDQTTWNNALTTIKSNGSGTSGAPKKYIITVSGNASVNGSTANSFGSVTDIEVTLVGNGSLSINTTGTAGSVLTVGNSQTAVINGPTLEGVPDNNAPVVYVGSGGKLKLDKGTICDNTNNGDVYGSGGGVYVYYGGDFTMSGGNITNNRAEIYGNPAVSHGGGVYVVGTFTMNGGEISGNTVYSKTSSKNSYSQSYGGGVFVVDGTFNMKGGAINNNTAQNVGVSGSGGGAYGGGVVIHNGTFTKTGGIIEANKLVSSNQKLGQAALWQTDTSIYYREADAGIGTNFNTTSPNGWTKK